MLTISIQQPWAWAIISLGKDVENRDWPTSIRGRILIHTGKKLDIEGVHFLRSLGHLIPHNLPTGGIVGSTVITSCVTHYNSTWFYGKYGFILSDTVALPFFPYPGRLGFFNVLYPNLNKKLTEAI